MSRSRNRRSSAAGAWLSACLIGLAAGADPLAPSTTTAPADPTPAAQWTICFPNARGVKTFTGKGVELRTDAPLDGPATVAHLEAVARYLGQLLPPPRLPAAGAEAPPPPARPDLDETPAISVQPPGRAVAVAVYASADDFHALWRRVEGHYGGNFGQIATEGYSFRTFCATWYETAEAFQRRRSVLCHEFAHVWLYQSRRLANDGNWLTEGIATAVQLRFFPASGDRARFAEMMEAGRMLPLKRLMDLPRIRPAHYWQAATLVEVIAAKYPQKLPEVVAAFNDGSSAHAIVATVLRTDFATLQKQWADAIRSAARVDAGLKPAPPPPASP